MPASTGKTNKSPRKAITIDELSQVNTEAAGSGVRMVESKEAQKMPSTYLSIALPGARVLFGFENNTWSEITDPAVIGLMDRGPHVQLAGLESTSLQDQARRIEFKGFELFPGFTGVIGGLGSGKTLLMERIIQEFLAGDGKPEDIFVISFLEPLERARYLGEKITYTCDSNTAFLRALAHIILVERPRLLVIDSLSGPAFQSWQDWATQTGAINSGFLFWTTGLSNLALNLGVTILGSFNPGPTQSSRGLSLVDILAESVGGRSHGYIACELGSNGLPTATYSARRPDGQRQKQDLTPLLALDERKLPQVRSGQSRSNSVELSVGPYRSLFNAEP